MEFVQIIAALAIVGALSFVAGYFLGVIDTKKKWPKPMRPDVDLHGGGPTNPTGPV